MPEIAGLFDVEVGGSEDVNQVLEEAREALVLLNLRAARHIDSAQRTISTLETRAKQLEQEAAKDPLTGLANRGRLDAYLDEQFAAAVETGQPLSVIIGDVDHFKAVNDTHGHPVGDRVLKLVAGAFGGRMRARDVVGRYGGEEFMLILPETDEAGAGAVAERLRSKIEAAALPTEGASAPVRVTMSFGHATTGPGRFGSALELLRAADEALYAAKRGGRNRVVGHGDLAGGHVEARHVRTLAS
jgi:diguanylate cyclase (GGDEF)-like protein